MTRRLACVDIPHFALQILLKDHPEWRNYPVVLLERDEANGRILDANEAAGELGLGAGMRYGASLGMHPDLKGGVVSPDELEKCRGNVEEALLDYSPHVERSWFQDGLYWLNARGLSAVFSSVRPWLESIESSIAALGYSCGLSAGISRFATFSAARLRPSGQLNIFQDQLKEEQWIKTVPVDLIPMSSDALRLFKRLKLISVADILVIPPDETARRLSLEASRMVRFIRDEGKLPLQYVLPRDKPEWFYKPEDPMIGAADLIHAGRQLLTSCLKRAVENSLHIQSVELHLLSDDHEQIITLKPARPTRSDDLLLRYWVSRIENLVLEHPVRELRCQAFFTPNRSPQADLFGRSLDENLHEAQKTLSAIQAERGSSSILKAEIIEDSLPTRRFRLSSWEGFPKSAVNSNQDMHEDILVRRVLLSPLPVNRRPNPAAVMEYTGGWWNVPYALKMAYLPGRHGWEWLQSSDNDHWRIIGRVD
jgi:protein ImuB